MRGNQVDVIEVPIEAVDVTAAEAVDVPASDDVIEVGIVAVPDGAPDAAPKRYSFYYKELLFKWARNVMVQFFVFKLIQTKSTLD